MADNTTIVKKVVGAIAGVPNPKSDWNETDSRKASYIDNKPDIDQMIADNTRYTNPDAMVNDIGGILASQHANGFNNVPINDLLTELLYPYTKPVIESFTLTPSAGVKKKGVAITLTGATAKIIKKSKKISKVDLYKGSTLLASLTDEITSAGTTVTFSNLSDLLDGNTNTTYTLKVSEENGTEDVVTDTETYTFVNPYYYGVISKDAEITEALVTGLTENVVSKGTRNYTYTTTSEQCSLIAYPKSYGVIKSIKDPNGFTQNWTQYTIKVGGVDYYVYVSGAAAATGCKYTFSY